MKTYSVLLTVDASIVVKVEAESEEEAKELAADIAEVPSICHHCSRNVQIGEILEAVEATEVTP
ncbi:hypothetical protein C4J93_1308 [Pseudomonas sp. R2-37-08W]|uniref:hypothetical protein n=1 Tax=Pseudomonas sp. R2-37-08W TaxID=1173273 RepID=UPI000F58741B|nr:hypothetical protein [Pseudomonas sp. R2-37-08W]AZF09522.1 hypothetical protein C4J93_1308 [Pseudomonas sp. R2-37-08W]